MGAIIEIKAVSKRFGAFYPVRGCSLSVEKGSITGLIGPNGAGKSALFNMMAGNIRPGSGRILLEGEDVTGWPAHELFSRGLLRTFQIAHEFSHLSVLENLMVVPPRRSGENLAAALFRPSRVAVEETAVNQKADDVIALSLPRGDADRADLSGPATRQPRSMGANDARHPRR